MQRRLFEGQLDGWWGIRIARGARGDGAAGADGAGDSCRARPRVTVLRERVARTFCVACSRGVAVLRERMARGFVSAQPWGDGAAGADGVHFLCRVQPRGCGAAGADGAGGFASGAALGLRSRGSRWRGRFVSPAAEGLRCRGRGWRRGEPLARWERMTCRFVPRSVLDATVSGSGGRGSAPVDECLDSDKSWVTVTQDLS